LHTDRWQVKPKEFHVSQSARPVAGTVAAALTAAGLVVAGPRTSDLQALSVGGWRDDPLGVVATAAGLAAWALVLWLAVSTALACAAALPGRVGGACAVVAQRCTPRLARSAARLLLGGSVGLTSLAGALAPAAYAATSGGAGALAALPAPGEPIASATQGLRAPGPAVPAPVVAPADPGTASPTPPPLARPPAPPARPAAPPADGPLGLPPPGEPAAGGSSPTAQSIAASSPAPAGPVPPAAPAAPTAPAAPASQRPGAVVVHRGDTLWSLARSALGPQATDAQIAAEWPRWWRANATVVGRDPDVLWAGQVLLPPTP